MHVSQMFVCVCIGRGGAQYARAPCCWDQHPPEGARHGARIDRSLDGVVLSGPHTGPEIEDPEDGGGDDEQHRSHGGA